MTLTYSLERSDLSKPKETVPKCAAQVTASVSGKLKSSLNNDLVTNDCQGLQKEFLGLHQELWECPEYFVLQDELCIYSPASIPATTQPSDQTTVVSIATTTASMTTPAPPPPPTLLGM